MQRSTRTRNLAALLAVATSVALAVAIPTSSAVASTPAADEAQLLTLTNQARAAVGAAPVTLDSTLTGIARQWAAKMAAAGDISHNVALKDQLDAAGVDWRMTGENVGYGPTLASIHAALLASPGHYANLTNPSFTKVGMGVVYANNLVWVVEDFMQLMGSSGGGSSLASVGASAPVTEPPVTSPPTTKPAPAPTTTAAPTTTTTTSTTTTLPPPRPADPTPATTNGLPMGLTLMLQQMLALPTHR